MSWVCVVEGRLTPMAEVHGFWSEAIRHGVAALKFTLHRLPAGDVMHAEIGRDDLPADARRAAAAAIAVDKEIAYSVKMTPAAIARTALMLRLYESSATVELKNYQQLLAVAVLKRIAPDPAKLLEDLADPYE